MQVAVVVRDVLALGLAAREAARAAAVGGDDASVASAIRRSSGGLDASAIESDVDPPASQRRRGATVTVSLSYVARLRVPLAGRVAGSSLVLRTSATMRMERDVPASSPSPGPSAGPDP